jgi:GrpB-like predicted nucleotidyltransferase (UPF0157 family)
MAEPVVVISYQSSWKVRFEELSARLSDALGSLVQQIEHVGSTAVPGLHAKPIVDLDIVISDTADFEHVRKRLTDLGYKHVGDQGIPGREAFELLQEGNLAQDHHLYVCRENAEELRRHIAFRDYLRDHPDVAAEYGQLKCKLAARFRDNRDAYTDAKSQFVQHTLEQSLRSH